MVCGVYGGGGGDFSSHTKDKKQYTHYMREPNIQLLIANLVNSH